MVYYFLEPMLIGLVKLKEQQFDLNKNEWEVFKDYSLQTI